MNVISSNTCKRKKFLANTNNKSLKLFKSEDELQVKTMDNNISVLTNNNDIGRQERDTRKIPLKLKNKQNKSLKEITKTIQFRNGESSETLPEFHGENTIKAKQTIKKKETIKTLTKKALLLQKLNERTKTEGKNVVLKGLNEKIDVILSRPEITKTAKRKLKNYKQLISLISSDGVNAVVIQSDQDSTSRPQKQKKKAQQNKNTLHAKNKNIEIQSKQEKPETECDEESVNLHVQENIKIAKKQNNIFATKENIADAENDFDEFDIRDDEEEGSEEKNDEESEESRYEEDKTKVDVNRQKVIKTKGKDKSQSREKEPLKNFGGNKSRYILFVGNIAYDTTKKELEQHFLTVGEVADVRIPTDKETSRPRGFAYVEFANEAIYQFSPVYGLVNL